GGRHARRRRSDPPRRGGGGCPRRGGAGAQHGRRGGRAHGPPARARGRGGLFAVSRARRPARRRGRGGAGDRALGCGRVTRAPVEWRPPSARRVRAIRERLRELYGVPGQAPHRRPLEELVLTVLSQSTNDRNRDVAYGRLRERFPSWEAVRDAPLEDVEAAIRPGGISKVKSARIQAILRAIGEPLDLSWLADAPVEEARAHLMELPGVGRKTAACVLLFSFGIH